MILVGQSWLIEREWLRDGSPVTSGTALVRVRRINAGTIEFLQADETTFDAADHTFSLAQSGNGWRRTFTVPASAAGFAIEAIAKHSVEPGDLAEEHYATVRDVDDLETEADAATRQTALVAEVDANETKIDAVKTVVDLLEDLLANRLRFDTAAKQWVLYADNGTTELRRWDAKDINGVATASPALATERDPA